MKIPSKVNILFLTVIFCLVIALSVRECQHQNLKQQINLPDSTNYFKGKLTAKERDSEAQKLKWHSDSLEMKASEIKYKRDAAKATKERDQARQKIQQIVNTIPEVKEFVELDSVSDKVNTDRIAELEIEKIKVTTDLNAIILTLEDQKVILHELVSHLTATNLILSKQVRKERRLKTVWKIVSGVLVAVVIYEAVQD